MTSGGRKGEEDRQGRDCRARSGGRGRRNGTKTGLGGTRAPASFPRGVLRAPFALGGLSLGAEVIC